MALTQIEKYLKEHPEAILEDMDKLVYDIYGYSYGPMRYDIAQFTKRSFTYNKFNILRPFYAMVKGVKDIIFSIKMWWRGLTTKPTDFCVKQPTLKELGELMEIK